MGTPGSRLRRCQLTRAWSRHRNRRPRPPAAHAHSVGWLRRKWTDMRVCEPKAYLISIVLLLAAPLLVAGFESPVDPPCRGHPAVVGPCFTVHGRVSAGNGTPAIRLWPVGSHRLLGVSDEGENLPQCVSAHLAENIVVFGDFLVCPFAPDRPGVMRSACIESASHLVVQEYRRDQEPAVAIPKVRACRLGE